MKTIRTPALILGLLYLCFFSYLALSGLQLPERLATHFDASGQPNGWMDRTSYLLFMAVFGIGFPLFVPAISYFSRFLSDRLQNIPHRDYWFASERRAVTVAYLFRHSLWFASMALCFVMGIHASILHANSLGQAFLSTPLVIGLAGCFLVGTVIGAVSLYWHFSEVA
ncbi:MAG: DUF1648 domain-containing protein [Verrucomicrobiota bacterium]|jgi:uncharacterized membrane protein